MFSIKERFSEIEIQVDFFNLPHKTYLLSYFATYCKKTGDPSITITVLLKHLLYPTKHACCRHGSPDTAID